jgi:N-acetylglucosaminyldiphosphoundecaprenol N-acetyl-beta-D-mannosaminyltransferase
MQSTKIVDVPLHTVDVTTAASLIVQWAEDGLSRVVSATNVHMVMEAHDDASFLEKLREADLSVADGKPLVWALRMLGARGTHVRGADLTEEVCRQAQEAGVPVGLYGSTPSVLQGFRAFVRRKYPALQLSLAISPPFRLLTPEEDLAMVEAIRESGTRILLVSLGCPKQELWMLDHREAVPCVMIGVGAAFDFLSGATPQAPGWMQRAGLEWLFRLSSDPRRLWKRYLKHNPRFVLLFGVQYAKHVALHSTLRKGDVGV